MKYNNYISSFRSYILWVLQDVARNQKKAGRRNSWWWRRKPAMRTALLSRHQKNCDNEWFSYSRECNTFGSSLTCSGVAEETDSCSENPCPVWTEWSEWTACSVTCGGGRRNKEWAASWHSALNWTNILHFGYIAYPIHGPHFCPAKINLISNWTIITELDTLWEWYWMLDTLWRRESVFSPTVETESQTRSVQAMLEWRKAAMKINAQVRN